MAEPERVIENTAAVLPLSAFAVQGKPWRDGWTGPAVKHGEIGVEAITEFVQQTFKLTGDDEQHHRVRRAQNGDVEAEREIIRRIREILRENRLLTAGMDEEKVATEVFDYLYGFRDLAQFYRDPEVEEIQVNRADNIFLIRNGRLERALVVMRDDKTLEHYLFPRLFAESGRAISQEHPAIEHVRLDGTRLSATMPPRSAHATLMVRKHNQLLLDPMLWASLGSASPRMLDVLGALVRWRVSLLASGPTASGKTTLVRLLVGYTPENMRWVTLATERELHLEQAYPTRNITEMEVGSRGEIADLFRIVLRYSPIAIVLEEIRNGAEAETMLLTVQRGHGGSMSTVHVTEASEIAFEVANMSLEGHPLDPTTIKMRWRQVAKAFPVVVQMAADPLVTGRRLIKEIGQYTVGGEDEAPMYEPVCVWRASGDLPYGEGAWHWVGTFNERVLETVRGEGGDVNRILVPEGTVDH